MFNLIPTPYRIYFWAVVVILVALSGAWVDHKLTVGYYRQQIAAIEVKLERLEVDLGKAKAKSSEFEAAYRSTAAAVVAQNKAVYVWKAEAARRGKLADVAVQKAAVQRRRAENNANRLYSLQLPKDECDALRKTIDVARAADQPDGLQPHTDNPAACGDTDSGALQSCDAEAAGGVPAK